MYRQLIFFIFTTLTTTAPAPAPSPTAPGPSLFSNISELNRITITANQLAQISNVTLTLRSRVQ